MLVRSYWLSCFLVIVVVQLVNGGVRTSLSKFGEEENLDLLAAEHGPLPSLTREKRRHYEMDILDAQNCATCNYTVIPIPNPGGRIPSELEHVKCNHKGSKCQQQGSYYCTQLYKNIKIKYENDDTDSKTEIFKLYSGCVCVEEPVTKVKPYRKTRKNIDA